MGRIELLGVLMTAGLIAAPVETWAQAGADDGSSGDPTRIPAATAAGWRWGWYRPYVITRGTADGGAVSTLHIPQGAFLPVVVVSPATRPAAAPPPVGLLQPAGAERPRAVRKADRDRSERLTTLGDRLFRLGNHGMAEDRYEQAVRLNPFAAAPRMRLAQLAIVRGRYGPAADRLREAEAAQPGWLVDAMDVRPLYADPEDVARQITLLEQHLRLEPKDRDALFVLGAQWFLIGRTDRAADVLLKLDDPRRRPDAALAAFLDAVRLADPIPPGPAPLTPASAERDAQP